MQGLYLVTPNWDDTDRLLDVTEQALQAGRSSKPVALLQYRHKHAGPSLRREQATALLALCRRHGVPFIVNDVVALCEQIDADGVHVGGTDASVAAVRAQLGAGKIVGASCYGDLALAVAAQDDGASYVAFGGFYPSLVKKYDFVTAPALLDRARTVIRVPTVVIGGMTPENAAPLVARGADMVAAITAVYQPQRPQTVTDAVHAFAALFSGRVTG
ncbi:thiamine-phosphate pyrophosphorylase [Duganella sp. Leaf126]|uniref:thiamine phosphate synthase n=1 Tax=Duganella sp. Leaf126 TaxID=1736266 RepID=UPI0006F85E22|nr:thiamine phosphate synthase [Duganella sp. Leaf126]KQQ33745.1 thiamine-phosphate pyrophosphorylase [Duganella sp. Leaf126]